MELEDMARRKEAFEVLLVKPGKNVVSAAMDDFERIPVTAADPLAAQLDAAVMAKRQEGYTFLFVAQPGVMTDPEIQARARAHAVAFDRTKV